MSGHSKWATTKHKKAANDAKRGKLFARLIKNIEVAARTGGGDPAGNPTLYDAIQKAKRNSVPADNIDRAVKRGSGDGADAVTYESVTYEGYASGGVAVLIECLTDNRNRAASEVRVALTRNGGQLADPGSVAYLFARKGVVEVPAAEGVDEDGILTAVLDAGADEVADDGDSYSVYSDAKGSRLGLPEMLVGINGNLIDFKALSMIFVIEVAQHHDALGAVFTGKDMEVEHNYLTGKVRQATQVALVVAQSNVDDAAHFHFAGVNLGLLLLCLKDARILHTL